jgi:Zn-dependent protease with chaperone function
MIAGAWCWNVLFSAGLSFLASLAVVWLFARRYAVARPRLAVLLLSMPFARAAIDVLRGVPEGAFFWERMAGAVQEKGAFRIGFGVRELGPKLEVALGAVRRGMVIPQSAADVLAAGLDRRVGHGVSAYVGLALAMVGLALAAREALRLGSASRACRRHVAAGSRIETRPLRGGAVRVVVSPSWSGVPFAGGLLRPWVCIGEALHRALTPEELDAVVLHELAHLRAFDAVLLVAVRMLRAALWFVPGTGWLARAIAAGCERAADVDAVARGAQPAALASALVRAAQGAVEDPRMLATFLHPGPALAQRVDALLHHDPAPSRWHARLARAALFLVVASTVLRLTACGNP